MGRRWGLIGGALLWTIACGEAPAGGGSGPDAGPAADARAALDAAAPPEDAGREDAAVDAGAPDAGAPDAEAPDDGGALDGGSDSGEVDGGRPDASDAGAPDAADAGPFDASLDAGPADSGPVDGGTLALTPTSTVIPMSAAARFTVSAPAGAPVVWAVEGVVGGGNQVGTVVPDGDPRAATYRAPRVTGAPPPGRFTISAAAAGELARATVDLAYVAPTLASVAPRAFDVGQPTTTATITGTGFTAQTAVYFGPLRMPLTTARWDRVTFEVSPTLLAFPGPVEVRVENPAPGGGAAAAVVQVILRRTQVGPGLPAGVPALFAGATLSGDPNRQPRLTYPVDEARAPRDFPSPEIAFQAAGGDDVCRVSVDGPGVALAYYASTQGWPAEENPHVQIPVADWGRILTANLGISLVLEVACGRLNGAGTRLVGGVVHASTPVAYVVEPQSAGGRIVYFSGLIEGLWRIELGGFSPVGVPWIGPTAAFQYQTAGCVGCHSLAPSGTRMSYTSGQAEFGVFETTSGNPSPLTGLLAANGAEWTAVHPSGQWVVGVDLMGRLVLYRAASGTTVQLVPAPPNRTYATQPFWSPQGDRLAFVASNTLGGGVHDVLAGEIWSIPFTATATPAFGAPTRLVARAGAGNDFYPAYSPDGQWLVFCRAPNGASFDNPGAQLMLTDAAGAPPVALGRANTARPRNYNSWPRWAPTHQAGRYWVVFSSQRPYPPLNGTGPQQLWVTEVDTTRWPADPSRPAVWLPGQAPFTGNLTAEWSASQ